LWGFLAKKLGVPAAVEASTPHSYYYRHPYTGASIRGGLSAVPDLSIDISTMRRHVRKSEQSSPITKSLINRDVETVIGDGLTITPEPQADIIGLSLEEAAEWSRGVASAFDLWATSPGSVLGFGRTNFYELQKMAYRSFSRDGELLAVLHYQKNKRLLNPLRVQLFDVEQLRGYPSVSTGGFIDKSADGIRRDENGTPVAYQIWQEKDGVQMPVELPARLAGGRLCVLHGFDPIFAGQGRGIPELGASIQWLADILKLTNAEVQKAINHASLSVFVESTSDEGAANPFESLTKTHDVWSKITGGGEEEEGGTGAAAGEEEPEQERFYEMPEARMDAPGIGVFNLPGHQTIKPFQSTAPSAGFKEFVEELFSFVGASRGQSLETVLMRFDGNYNKARAALLLMWRVAQNKRNMIGNFFLLPIYEMWLSEEIAAGRITARGWSDPLIRQAWLRCHLVGAPLPNIDPEKTMRAAGLEVLYGISTLEDKAMETNGSSFEANAEKLRKEFAALNLPPWAANYVPLFNAQKGQNAVGNNPS